MEAVDGADDFVDVVHRLYASGVPLAQMDRALSHSVGWLKSALRNTGRQLQTPPEHVRIAPRRPADLTARIVQLRESGLSWRLLSEQVGLTSHAVRHRYAAQVREGRTVV